MSEPMKVKVEIEVQDIADEIIRKLIEDGTLVEVVRCKDCKWWTKQEASLQGRCDAYGMYPTGDWYCARGERKDDDKC